MAPALSANSCSTNIRIQFFFNNNRCCYKQNKQNLNFFKIRASSNEQQQQQDCNVEECAPDKEVGKVSMEWLVGEKTKVAGTFPPRRREWSGYVEKDTAGQTNIYSVEPAVYVAESAISSGTSGTSADGAENTAALVAFSSIIAVAAASVVLFQVGKNPPPVQTLDYSGPSLSYYITKFKPSETVQISVPTEITPSAQSENSTTQVESGTLEIETSASSDKSTTQVESGTLETEPSALSDNSTTQVDSRAPETETSSSGEQAEITVPQVSEVQVESG